MKKNIKLCLHCHGYLSNLKYLKNLKTLDEAVAFIIGNQKHKSDEMK